MDQKCQCIRPKFPNRPQQGGKQGEKQHESPQRTQQHVDPQLALGPVQGEQEQGGGGAKAVQAVQRPCKPGQAQAERPQQVVSHPCRQPQQNGLEEYRQLLIDVIPHITPAAAAAGRPGRRQAPHRSGSRSSPPPAARRPPATAAQCAGSPP